MTLFIDACVRENSRTKILADYLLSKIDDEIQTVKLEEAELPLVDEVNVIMRYAAYRINDFSEHFFNLSKQFANADQIVIAAPFWDLSFPALLKRYFEDINISGIVFKYSDKGIPISLCKAKRLYYVTTSGGPIFNDAYGFGYVKEIAHTFFGIQDCKCISAQNLDVQGTNVEEILNKAKQEIDNLESLS